MQIGWFVLVVDAFVDLHWLARCTLGVTQVLFEDSKKLEWTGHQLPVSRSRSSTPIEQNLFR